MDNKINVLIVDDHKMFLDGVVTILKDIPEINIVSASNNGFAATEVLKNNVIDVLISDIGMPEINGRDLCKLTKEISPDTKTLIVTMYDDIYHITSLLEHGASGYILKNTGKEELIKAIRSLWAGDTFYSEKVKDTILKSIAGKPDKKKSHKGSKLTEREIEIIKLIATECTTQEIADRLFISLHTVESHRKNIFRKTDVKNMAGLIKYALKSGIIE